MRRIPRETAAALRPVLTGLADETIAAIADEVPDYARAMEGAFGGAVRRGVEIAFERFLELVEDPQTAAQRAPARSTSTSGRGEFHAGRSLDALLAAYRVGARLAWRRFVEAGREAGLSPEVLYDLGEAIFAYIDEISAESADGYAQEQSAAAGEAQRRRRRLVRLLAEDPPAPEEAVRTAAAAAAGRCRGGVAALVAGAPAAAGEGAVGAAQDELDDAAVRARAAARAAPPAAPRRGGSACVFVPDPDAPGRRRAARDRAGRRARGARPDRPVAARGREPAARRGGARARRRRARSWSPTSTSRRSC